MNLARIKRGISRRMHVLKRRFSRPIAFMHIPKTAGTSINKGLWLAFQPVNPLKQRVDTSLYGSFDRFNTFDQTVIEDVFFGTKPMPKHTDFISGHFSLSTIQTHCPKAKVVTFLREPCTRILSHWLYWRSLPEANVKCLGDMGNNIRAARYGLIDFLSIPANYCQLDNLQTRMLLWPHPFIPNDELISEKHDDMLVQQALIKLHGLSHVDVVENPELEKNLSAWLSKPFNLPKLNVTIHNIEHSKATMQHELTPEVWERLNHLSRLDLKLWFASIAKRMSGINAQELRARVIEKTIKRYASM